MSRAFTHAIIVLLVACTSQPPLDERFTQGAACYERPYAASIDLQTRGQVSNWDFGLQLYDAPQGNVVGRLEPGEYVRVVAGPVCWHVPQTSNNRQDYRVWQVESESRELTGWIHEYAWGMLTGIQYGITPLAAGELGITAGQALLEPLRIADSLPEHAFLAETTGNVHPFTAQDYGYVTIALAINAAELVDPDAFAGEQPCRVIGLLEPAAIPTTIMGDQMEIGSRVVNRIWLEPGDYSIQVDLRYIPRADNDQTTCPATAYTLTIAPVQ